jgi:hypothetical protein
MGRHKVLGIAIIKPQAPTRTSPPHRPTNQNQDGMPEENVLSLLRVSKTECVFFCFNLINITFTLDLFSCFTSKCLILVHSLFFFKVIIDLITSKFSYCLLKK